MEKYILLKKFMSQQIYALETEYIIKKFQYILSETRPS